MLISQILGSMRSLGNDQWSAEVGEDWSQGRATFGGMVAALGNEAMRRLVPADRALRGLDTTFVGPALAGTLRIDAQVLRAGKIVTMAAARVWSADQIAATLTGVYGGSRATQISISPQADAGVPAAEDLPDSIYPPNMGGPGFLNSAREGYACETSTVIDPAGAPAALSRQLVTVYG